VLLLFYFISCASDAEQYEWRGRTMGTTYQVKVTNAEISEEQYVEIRSRIDTILKEVNLQMSTWDPKSEISLFNQSKQTSPYKVSIPFYDVIKKSLDIYHMSDGAFDITVAPLVNLWGFGAGQSAENLPNVDLISATMKKVGSDKLLIPEECVIQKTIPDLQLDLSAIAKGYGVDVVTDLVRSYGFKNYMVEIGGEVVVSGINASGDLWKIGIDRPQPASLPGQRLESILAIQNVAVATSGDYRNYYVREGQLYSHTINPKTGKPVTHNLASVTVITKSCVDADGLATATMVLGPENGLDWIERMPDVEALLIIRESEDKFKTSQTSGFEKYLVDTMR